MDTTHRDTAVMSRKQYMDSDCHKALGDREASRATHRRYYAQLVNENTIRRVVAAIGPDRLLASTAEHFNDIPLDRWVRVSACIPIARRFEELGDYTTTSGLVCVAKEAAQQWLDRQQAGDQ